MARSSLLGKLQERSGQATRARGGIGGRARTTMRGYHGKRRRAERVKKSTGKSAPVDGCLNGAGAGPAPANESDPRAPGTSGLAPMRCPAAVLSSAGNLLQGGRMVARDTSRLFAHPGCLVRTTGPPGAVSISPHFAPAPVRADVRAPRPAPGCRSAASKPLAANTLLSIIMNYCGVTAAQAGCSTSFRSVTTGEQET